MNINSDVMRWAVLALALAPLISYLLAIYSAWRFFGARRNGIDASSYTPPVSILKPVRGLDREAYENFSSFCRQDYPQYEIIFVVCDSDDPAIPVIQRLIQDFPKRSIRLLVGAKEVGSNSKINKLCRLARNARYDLLVASDSDIRVDPDYLRAVVAPFRDARVGVVTCMFRGLADRQLGAELEAVGTASEFFAGVLVARQLEGVKFAMGSTMATTRKHLAEIGGFEALSDQHSDDFELGKRIAACGHQVELSSHIVWTIYPAQTVRSFFEHQLRWARTTRHCRPWGYLGLLLTFGLPWSIAAAAVAPSRILAAAYLGAYLALRFLAAWTVGIWGLKDPVLRRRWWLVPLRDALQFCVWLASFSSNRITWRGNKFVVHRDRMVAVGARPEAAPFLRSVVKKSKPLNPDWEAVPREPGGLRE